MENSEATTTKSSNEILSELFGAFNAEPPKIVEKPKSSGSDAEDSEHSKKSKKSKRKKSKKKHKSKKHKRKHSDSGRESDSSITKMKKKKKKSKEKKCKKSDPTASPNNLNIELPVNQVPMALEIMLDGTVGIKREDGGITKIPDNNQLENAVNDANSPTGDNVTNCENSNHENEETMNSEKIEDKEQATAIKVPEIFEAEPVDQSKCSHTSIP